jgi:deoxyribose-phosphate aldolase
MTKLLNSKTITRQELAKTIDHSLLKPELTDDEVVAGLEVAKKYDTATVCVKPCHMRLAAKMLENSAVVVSTVIGFPHGSNVTAIKVAEARQAVADGAFELDMVLNIGKLRSGELEYVYEDIKAVVDAVKGQALVKVILENAYLTPEEIKTGCELIEKAGGDFVKTSTGFAPGGATHEDLKLMRATVSDDVQVKAAGGVRTLDAALAVIDLGVTRIGATATSVILDEYDSRAAGEAPSTPDEQDSSAY